MCHHRYTLQDFIKNSILSHKKSIGPYKGIEIIESNPLELASILILGTVKDLSDLPLELNRFYRKYRIFKK